MRRDRLLLASAAMSLILSGSTVAKERGSSAPVAPVEPTGSFAGEYEVLQPLAERPGRVRTPEHGRV